MTTRAEQRHLSRLSDLGCVLCDMLGRGGTPAEIHHLRAGVGMSQRSSHFMAVPLCPECHRGPHGVHGDHALLRQAKTTELGLLDETLRRVFA